MLRRELPTVLHQLTDTCIIQHHVEWWTAILSTHRDWGQICCLDLLTMDGCGIARDQTLTHCFSHMHTPSPSLETIYSRRVHVLKRALMNNPCLSPTASALADYTESHDTRVVHLRQRLNHWTLLPHTAPLKTAGRPISKSLHDLSLSAASHNIFVFPLLTLNRAHVNIHQIAPCFSLMDIR